MYTAQPHVYSQVDMTQMGMMGAGGIPIPGTVPGAMPGTMPGMMPGTMPGAMPGTMPGMMPGMMPTGPAAVRTCSPNYFLYYGPPLSLKARMDLTTNEQLQTINDCNVNILGTQIQAINICCMVITYLLGGFCIFPLIFTCMDWWKKCTFAANSIDISFYRELQKLIKAPNVRNFTLTVNDNTFDKTKAGLLHAFVSESNLKGFTFVNTAGNYDFNNSEFSDFIENMRPIKYITRVMSDMRWGPKIVTP